MNKKIETDPNFWGDCKKEIKKELSTIINDLTDINCFADYIENPRKVFADNLRKEGFTYFILNVLGIPLKCGIVVGSCALVGEVLDHIPYINTTIPEVIRVLTKSEYFYGNIDKLGALLGFLRYYLHEDIL